MKRPFELQLLLYTLHRDSADAIAHGLACFKHTARLTVRLPVWVLCKLSEGDTNRLTLNFARLCAMFWVDALIGCLAINWSCLLLLPALLYSLLRLVVWLERRRQGPFLVRDESGRLRLNDPGKRGHP